MSRLADRELPDDSPRLAYRVLERRTTLGIVGVLLALAAASWWYTIERAAEMEGMAHGLASVGTAMPMNMAAPIFLAMWTAMMAAMMLPAVGPVVLVHRMVLRRRGRGPGRTAVFVGGYLAIWAAVGVVPLAVLAAFRGVTEPSTLLYRAGGAALVLAGAYQFTRWKDSCLRACRTPLTFISTYDFGATRLGVFRAGAAHGLYCLGCCWALMTVLFVVGLMNLVWMAAVAAVFVAEKNAPHAIGLTRAVGVALLLAGALVLADPDVLAAWAGNQGHTT